MMRLHYAGGTAVASDQLCAALFRYAIALADRDRVGLAAFPTIGEDGLIHRVHVLLGRTSQLWAVEVHDASGTLDDQAAVDELDIQTRNLVAEGTHRYAAPTTVEEDNLDFDLDIGVQ